MEPEPDRYVIEIAVPPPVQQELLYCTGGQDVFVKVEGGRLKMTPLQIQEWIRCRILNDGR
jgi:hypothetical protein